MGSLVLQVKNRTEKDFEFMCDGQVHIVPAGEIIAFPDYIAMFGINKSVISFNPDTGVGIKALVLAGTPAADEMIEARKPDSEIIDRTHTEGELKTIKFTNPDLPRTRISGPLGEE